MWLLQPTNIQQLIQAKANPDITPSPQAKTNSLPHKEDKPPRQMNINSQYT